MRRAIHFTSGGGGTLGAMVVNTRGQTLSQDEIMQALTLGIRRWVNNTSVGRQRYEALGNAPFDFALLSGLHSHELYTLNVVLHGVSLDIEAVYLGTKRHAEDIHQDLLGRPPAPSDNKAWG